MIDINIDLMSLNGEWIKRNSNYEHQLCQNIGWDCRPSRYFDAISQNLKIEIKKGKSIWLDLIRYSELVLNINDQTNIAQDTVTAFFIPNNERNKINIIYLVETKKILEMLELTKEKAEIILSISNSKIRSINMQASITVSDVRKNAFKTFI